MNKFILKYKFTFFFFISIVLTISLGVLFNLTLLNVVLLTIAFPLSVIFIISTPYVSKRFQKLLHDYALRYNDEYDRVEKFKKIAKREGKREFLRGGNKQHSVWSTSEKQATKIYNKHIKPLEEKYPKKVYYWIFNHCNNTKNGQ